MSRPSFINILIRHSGNPSDNDSEITLETLADLLRPLLFPAQEEPATGGYAFINAPELVEKINKAIRRKSSCCHISEVAPNRAFLKTNRTTCTLCGIPIYWSVSLSLWKILPKEKRDKIYRSTPCGHCGTWIKKGELCDCNRGGRI